MINTINKSFLLLLLLFFGASVVRVALNNYEYIGSIIAFVNSASFLYVCYLIFDDSNRKFVEILKLSNHIGEQVKERKREHYKSITNYVCIFLLIIGVLYSLFYANTIINDIIGFQALFLSIESDYISECIAKKFNKKL